MTLPNPPNITKEVIEQCRKCNDFSPVLFELYKYVGTLCYFYASLQLNSPDIRNISPIQHYVLMGLLNRCSKLMLSNIALSHEGLFGEATNIIDRCISESAIKIIWLCRHKKDDYFNRFLSGGLKTELEFKKNIEEIILNRGKSINIEERMLMSIQDHIDSSKLSESEIKASKKLPNMSSMIDSLWGKKIMYVIIQRIGSHHVHGTWPSLRLHYLKDECGVLRPKGHECETHINQYIFISLLVLDAIKDFIKFICKGKTEQQALQKLPTAIEKEIMKINKEVIGEDFEST